MNYKKARNKLIEIMNMKREALAEVVNVNYFDAFDEIVIKNWSDEVCEQIYSQIEHCVQYGGSNDDAGICPFCVYSTLVHGSMNCLQCTYGFNHGFCNSEDSHYATITSELHVKGYNSIKSFMERSETWLDYWGIILEPSKDEVVSFLAERAGLQSNLFTKIGWKAIYERYPKVREAMISTYKTLKEDVPY